MNISMPQPVKKTPGIFKLFIPLGLLALAAGALLYWHTSSRIILQGTVSGTLLPVASQGSGKLEQILITEGEAVTKGQILMLLENSALKEAYLKEEQARLLLEAAIPPQFLMYDSTKKQAIALHLEQARQVEEEARSVLQQAASEEARTAVNARRARIRRDEGQITEAELQQALQSHEQAITALGLARAGHEKASLARASASAELRSFQDTQALIARDERIAALLKNHELQTLKAHAAAEAFTASIIYAPHSGIVAGIARQSGSLVTAGETVAFLSPLPFSPDINAYAAAEDAARIRPGMSCSVSIPSAGRFEGVVQSVFPRAPAPAVADNADAPPPPLETFPFRVRVRIYADQSSPAVPGKNNGTDASPLGEAGVPPSVQSFFPLIMEGTKAEVTIYLNTDAREDSPALSGKEAGKTESR